ncbi:MAG: NAD(P)/FAD-dependent oxidoreductase [Bacteroidota bacterium]|nr:FAD-dependent monooxygenase [Candidatus Kapabacteria bacterium]MDW8220221.1 NAD(P)/FAD-dependent oxidoreductase [Bacteroidota bacterium]
MRTHRIITIVGGGLVGSLCAIMLGNRGYTVHVFDRRRDVRTYGGERGRSINLALSHRGVRALQEAGISAQIDTIGVPMRGRMIHYTDGSMVFQPYGKDGEAIYSVSRAALNQLLLNAAEQHPHVHLHFEECCCDVDVATARALFTRADGSTHSVSADCVIGADGAYSVVRGVMQKYGRFNYEQHYLEHGYKELTIPSSPNGTWVLEPNALHIWPRGRYMFIALPNVDGSFTCTLFLPFESTRDDEPSFEDLHSAESIHNFFCQAFPDVVQYMPHFVEEFIAHPTSTLITIRCTPWFYQDRVMLIGDAAHAIVPFYGQGMNAGFEDCRIFSELLAQYHDNWLQALREYHTQRKPNADAIAHLAMQNFVEMSERVADPMFLLRKRIEQHCHTLYPHAFIPVYSMVTFSHIPYVEALQEMERQEAVLNRIMCLERIKERWNTPEGEETIRSILRDAGYAV